MARADERDRLTPAGAPDAAGDDRLFGARAEEPARGVAGERLLERRARGAQERARIGAEDVGRLGDEHELVEAERFALLGDQRREREATLVELAAVDRDQRPIDQLPRLAGTRDELAIPLRLARDLARDARAGRVNLAVEALGLVAAAVLAQDEAEPRRRRRGEEADREDQARREPHGAFLARVASPRLTPPVGDAARVTSGTRAP